ncbi:MAG: hypothetical protein ACLQGV_18815 [Bryobacteraceae bacterium]
MPNLKGALLATVLLATLAPIACGPPVYAYRVPPPPPPILGVVGYAPGPGYVWIDGFYDLRGSAWVWRPGYWVRPPHPHAVWVRAYWEPHGHSYRFHRGYWRH